MYTYIPCTQTLLIPYLIGLGFFTSNPNDPLWARCGGGGGSGRPCCVLCLLVALGGGGGGVREGLGQDKGSGFKVRVRVRVLVRVSSI
jgi:hypothetical protein